MHNTQKRKKEDIQDPQDREIKWFVSIVLFTFIAISILLGTNISFNILPIAHAEMIEEGSDYMLHKMQGVGKYMFESKMPEIYNGTDWVDHIIFENSTVIQLESAQGSFVYHKNYCNTEFFQAGNINASSPPILTSESWIVHQKNQSETDPDWNYITDVNEASCTDSIFQNQTDGSTTITSNRTATDQATFSVKYIKKIGEDIKLIVSVINENPAWTNHSMGFVETIHAPNTVEINGTNYHIPSNNNTFFNHTYFVNYTQGIGLANGIYYDLGLGLANLLGVTLLDEDNTSKVVIDYSYSNLTTGVNEIFEIDPTFASSGVTEGVQESDNDTICDDTGGSYNSESSLPSSYLWDLFLTDDCIRGYIRVDISSIPTSADSVTDARLKLDPTSFTWIGSPESTRTNDMTTDPIGRTNAQQFDEINDGVNMASFAISSTSPVTIDLGPTADTRFLSHIQSARGWISVGLFQADETMAAADQGWYRSTSTSIEIDYTVSTPLTAPFDLNATAVAPDLIELLWSHDLANVTTFDIYRNNTLVASRDNTTLGFSDANQEIFSLTLENSLQNATGLEPLTPYEYHVCATSLGDSLCTAVNATATTSDDTNVWELKEHDGDTNAAINTGTVTDAASTFDLESDAASFGRGVMTMFKSFNATEIFGGDPKEFGSDLEAFYEIQDNSIFASNTFGRMRICDGEYNRFDTNAFGNELDGPTCPNVSDFSYTIQNTRNMEDPNRTLQPRAILDWKEFTNGTFTVAFNMRDRNTTQEFDLRMTNFTITNQTTWDFADVQSLNYSSVKTCDLKPVGTNSADDCDLGVVEFSSSPHVELKATQGSNDWQYMASDHNEGLTLGFEEIRVESDGIHLETLDLYTAGAGQEEETLIMLFKQFNVSDIAGQNFTIKWSATGGDVYENSIAVVTERFFPLDRYNFTQFAKSVNPDNNPVGDTLGSKGFATTSPTPLNPPFASRTDTFFIDGSLTSDTIARAQLRIHDNSRIAGADFIIEWITVGPFNYSFTGGGQSIQTEVRNDRNWGDRGLITPNQTIVTFIPPFNPPNNVQATTDLVTSINVTWTPFNATFVDGYRIYNSSTGSEPFDLLATTGNFTGQGFFLHTPLPACQIMNYKVAAFNQGGNGPNSTVATGNSFCVFVPTFNSILLENIGDTFKISGDFDFTGGNLTSIVLRENGTITDTDSTGFNASATTITNIPYLFWERDTVGGPRNFTVTATGQTPVYTTGQSSISDTATREYQPQHRNAIVETQGQVNFTLQRFADETDILLKVNRINVPTGETWQIECIYQNVNDAIATKDSIVPEEPTVSWVGLWDNATDTGYFNSTYKGAGGTSAAGSHIYISCFNDLLLFSTTSFTNASLSLFGIQAFDTSFGSLIGVPAGIFMLVLMAGMANKRTSPTWIVVITGAAGVMSVIGFFSLDPIVWGLALVTAMLGLFVNQKVF